MNVAYHCSNTFAQVLGVSIASLFSNNRDVEIVDVYVIDDKISPENKANLMLIAGNYGRSIKFIPMPDVNKVYQLGLKDVRGDWIFNSYCRLFLHETLPLTVHRVLYLDCDTLICGDLSDLWKTDMKDFCLACVQDALGNEYKKLFRIDEGAKYCNSGVILQNLDLWREQDNNTLIKEYISSNSGYVYFMEQTVLNAVFQNKIKILPLQYNVFTLLNTMTYDELIKFKHVKDFYRADEVEFATEHPIILHLTTCFLVDRPWIENSMHPAEAIYRKYKMMTPWKDTPDHPADRSMTGKAVRLLVDHMPRKAVISFAGFANRYIRVTKIKVERRKAIGQ